MSENPTTTVTTTIGAGSPDTGSPPTGHQNVVDVQIDADENARVHQRNEHFQPVRVRMFDQAGTPIDEGWAEITNLSTRGVRIRGLRLYRQTEITSAHSFGFTIVLEDGAHFIETRSAPRWADDDGELGLEFDTVDVHVA